MNKIELARIPSSIPRFKFAKIKHPKNVIVIKTLKNSREIGLMGKSNIKKGSFGLILITIKEVIKRIMIPSTKNDKNFFLDFINLGYQNLHA